ncbi:MAG TPA: glycosyltransferase [Candidatus Paceibacterota bacterium]|nr:glycosyltransferase [Candidatus Paceibacterota bacterium]
MKVLYNILNPYGLGADRWIYEGYKSAFEQGGHDFFTVTEQDDLMAIAEKVQPDLFFLDFLPFMDYCKRVRDVPPDFLERLRKNKTKIFCEVALGIDKEEDSEEKIAFFRKYLPVVDICFCNYSPETTKGFKELYGKEMHFVPHAADATRYFPGEPEDRFRCDIAFLGSFYTQKRPQFEELLLPLMKKYHVRIYGSGWTISGKLLRVVSGVARRLRIEWLVKLANKNRITISMDDERTLYASAKICVNIHEYYRDGTTKGFSNEREFKLPASGGFEISDYVPGMERYFDLGKEIVAVRSKEEWFEKIDYYLRHDEERKKIQEEGTARVLRDHTYAHRVDQLLSLYNSPA